MIVNRLEKGTGYSPGNVVTFSYAPSNYSESISPRTIVRVSMVKNGFGQLSLIGANHWEKICE
jgi:hypothetical protein